MQENDATSRLTWLNLGLRVVMETGIVVALAVWGYSVSDGAVSRWVLAIAAPAIGFGFWGAIDFRQAGRYAEPLRLIQELVVSGLAAGAWYSTGAHVLAVGLAAVSILYHSLVYLAGDRLLRDPAAA